MSSRRSAVRQKKARRPVRKPDTDRRPHVRLLESRASGEGSDVVTIAVRLTRGRGAARHAAFHVWTDPDELSYMGYEPSGRGVIIAAPSARPGELVVYRSSLPGGFARSEALVRLHYRRVSPGTSAVRLADVRLLDGRGRDLELVYEKNLVLAD